MLIRLKMFCDNKQTVSLLKNEAPVLSTKLKHVDIYHHWLRQEVQSGRIELEWVRTCDMIADGMTKVLPSQQFKRFRDSLAVIKVPF